MTSIQSPTLPALEQRGRASIATAVRFEGVTRRFGEVVTLAAASASTGSFRSLRAFVAIELRRTLRNRRYVMFAIAFPVVFHLLYTGILSGAGADPTALVGGIQWRTYFMVSMASYAAIVAALSGAVVIARERESGWTRQLQVTPLPPMAYVAGKLLISFIVTIPAIAAVMVAGLVVNHVELSAGRWLELLVVLVAASLPFAALASWRTGPSMCGRLIHRASL